MLNEWKEFRAYTGTVSYTASRKSDMTYLGRFTFATILEFEGMARILAILARGYLFHDKSGAVVSGDPRDRIAYARRALCAWCSAPEKGKTAPKDEWQFKTDFWNCAWSFRNWWTRTGPAGSSVMSWLWQILC